MADLRQACDRCHSKKLRCTKILGSIVCTRCVKAGVSCLFSPPTRSLRQPDHAAFDWSPMLGLDEPAIDPIPIPDIHQDVNPGINLDHLMTAPPVSADVDSAPSTQGTEVFQLTDLMAALDRLQHQFPTSERQHLSRREMKEFMDSCKFDLGAFLEELLQLSQKLLRLYPSVLKRLEPEDNTCNAPDCIHNSQQFLRTGPGLSIDQPLIHLLLACHLRLLELFENIVNHGRMCAHAIPLMPKDHEPTFDIPEIRIGSFVAPKVSAASMMIAMIIELQSSLNMRAQQLHDTVSSAVGHESRAAKILGLQCESLKEHAVTTLTDLYSLKDSLLKLGLIS
ncbi:hypothetical protein FSARC_5832 [Fusarium sarcochroum]|uniref:Zn(2)-C6 fungal-type domain-containing protein n=1 Tax=Fusarium sarcochroum TaxID=1208366 RepID=A0A8H4TYP4_9HYPO|nr:hypothetical protein FSARC_5832 [Fusarium sarcochroum]